MSDPRRSEPQPGASDEASGAGGQPAIDSWVDAEALDPWLRIISRLCAYTFDELDSTIVSIGLSESQADDDTWYEYLLDGEQTITVRMADAPSVARVMVRVWCPDPLLPRAELATSIAQEYRLGLR